MRFMFVVSLLQSRPTADRRRQRDAQSTWALWLCLEDQSPWRIEKPPAGQKTVIPLNKTSLNYLFHGLIPMVYD